MPTTDPTEILDILRLAPGGEGIAQRQNGEIIFVPATAPGDRVEIGQVARSRGRLRGELLRVIVAGPDRREPPCPFAASCGGCDFMHLTPESQHREKLAMLESALTRVGGNPQRPACLDVEAACSRGGYRARLRLHIDKDGRAGMYSAGSHRVVPIDRCFVADPTINTAIAQLASADPAGRRRLSFCEQLEIRSAQFPPTLAVRLFPRGTARLRPELYTSLFPEGTLVVVAASAEDNDLTQTLPVTPELSLRVPLSAFSQAHTQANQSLVAAVVGAARLRHLRTFLDAYAGAGNFALPLLLDGLTGEAVDFARSGIYAARALARELHLPVTGFNVGDARSTLDHFANTRRQFEYIVLDPPREGAKTVLDAALRLKPRTIALVACDQVALARDLHMLTSHGGRIDSLTMFDMFPETHHSETLAIVDCE
jgi:23S rRNA (uracil1939-C5)-methyltransferase